MINLYHQTSNLINNKLLNTRKIIYIAAEIPHNTISDGDRSAKLANKFTDVLN